MLKRTKKYEKEKTPASSEITTEEKSLLTSGSLSDAEQTVIGEQIRIDGSIHGEEHLVINGAMKGTIELKKHNFTIGSKGRFEGKIQAKNVSVSGELKGDINTPGKVQITKEADFIGEIKAGTISVEDGAYFKGVIELQREPHRTSLKEEKADLKTSVPPGKGPGSMSQNEDKMGN